MSEAIDLLADFDPFGEGFGAGGGADRRRYVLLDVFTDRPLAGNALAVFTDARGLPAAEMQQLARELNLSETVFVLPPSAGGDVSVRIFTPAAELPFAGHPVLGAAAVVGAALGRETLTLETPAAPIPVSLVRVDGRVSSGWMRQPVPSWAPYERAQELLGALGVESSGLPVEIYDNGPHHVCVELSSEGALAALTPDLRALSELGALGASCFAGAGDAWKARVFAPALGVSEDPATGSAAGPLAVHLARHGRIAFGAEIEIRQGEEIGRPSLLRARTAGSPARVDAVEVGGQSVMLACGDFLLDRSRRM